MDNPEQIETAPVATNTGKAKPSRFSTIFTPEVRHTFSVFALLLVVGSPIAFLGGVIGALLTTDTGPRSIALYPVPTARVVYVVPAKVAPPHAAHAPTKVGKVVTHRVN